MDRITLQAERYIQDAQILLSNGRYDTACCVCGYAVECALKACVAKRMREHVFPDPDFAKKVFTHKLDTLLEYSGLAKIWQDEQRASLALAANWATIKDWTERSHYENRTEMRAEEFVKAVSDQENGVLTCINKYW